MSADLEHISDEEIAKLKACNSEDEWNATCTEIKEARGGRAYPRDWFHKIVQSGFMDQVAAKWGGSSEITITTK